MPVEDRIEDAAPETPEPYDAPEPPARRRRRTFGALLIAAAAIAVVALAAHVYWQRGAGGAGGDVPLLRAEPGPARERPSDPGGMTVPYRDLLALHELGAPGGETGEPVVERLLPPPETPLPRPRRAAAPADAPPAAVGAEIEIAPAPPPPSAGATPEVREPQITPTAAPPAGTPIAPTAAALTEGAPAPEEGARDRGESARVEEIVVAAEPPPSDSPPDETAAAEAPPAPPARKPDPPPRREAPAAAADDDAPQTIEDILALAAEPGTAVPDAAVPGTGFAVQLGAYRTEEEAEQAWDNAVERAPEVLGPARHFIAQADLGGGGGVVHRLRIGPLPGRGGADDLCRRLQGAGIACFTVEP